MSLKWICAISENGIMWNKDKIPRHKKEDLKRFKALTQWKIVALWRKTYDSLKYYWPNSEWYPHAKENIVISRHWWTTIPNVINRSKAEEIRVLWWWEIFKQLMPYIDELYLTIVEWNYEWDTKFPENFKQYFDSKKTKIENWLDEWTKYETYYKSSEASLENWESRNDVK